MYEYLGDISNYYILRPLIIHRRVFFCISSSTIFSFHLIFEALILSNSCKLFDFICQLWYVFRLYFAARVLPYSLRLDAHVDEIVLNTVRSKWNTFAITAIHSLKISHHNKPNKTNCVIKLLLNLKKKYSAIYIAHSHFLEPFFLRFIPIKMWKSLQNEWARIIM